MAFIGILMFIGIIVFLIKGKVHPIVVLVLCPLPGHPCKRSNQRQRMSCYAGIN